MQSDAKKMQFWCIWTPNQLYFKTPWYTYITLMNVTSLTCDVRAGGVLLQEDLRLLKAVHLLENTLQLFEFHH